MYLLKSVDNPIHYQPFYIYVPLYSVSSVSQVLMFPSKDNALSFIAMLDGYHRLREDYHHSLCPDIQSPLQKQLQDIGCHGPVSLVIQFLH